MTTRCEFFLVQYAPSIGDELRVPVGLVLLDEAGGFLRYGFSEQFRAARCLDPHADLEVLRSLPLMLDQLVREDPAGDARRALFRASENAWGRIRIAPPRGVETDDPEREFTRLFEEHIERRRPAGAGVAPRAGSRRWIQAQLKEALERKGLWDRLQHGLPVEQFTAPGDGFRIDHAYRPNGVTKYIHAISLRQDWNQAKVLSYTFGRIRARIPATLTAVVGDDPADAPASESCRGILLDAEISVQPLSELSRFLEEVRRDVDTHAL